MSFRERFLRVYSEADWFAYLVLSTSIVAAINFADIFSERATFYPRFFVLAGLLVATPNAFKRTVFNRLLASIGSGVALAAYVFWWIGSYRSFRNFEEYAGIQALIHPHVKHFAYLYQGTPIDLGIALSIAVCLVLLLDRLFDGEKNLTAK